MTLKRLTCAVIAAYLVSTSIGPEIAKAELNAVIESTQAAQESTYYQEEMERRRKLLLQPLAAESGTGKDVLILQQHKLYYLRAKTETIYTSNAYSQNGDKNDIYFTNQLKLGADTLIGGKYRLLAEGNLTANRYDEYSELNSDALGAKLSLSRQIKSMLYGIHLNRDYLRKSGIGSRILASTRASLSATWFKPISENAGWMVDSSLAYSMSSPDDYDTIKGVFSPSIYWNSKSTPYSIYTGAWVSYTDYEHYYPEFFSRTRKDINKGAYGLIRYSPRQLTWLRFEGGARLIHNKSTLHALNYTTTEAHGRVVAFFRF